jgi:predicted Zn-dependent protease
MLTNANTPAGVHFIALTSRMLFTMLQPVKTLPLLKICTAAVLAGLLSSCATSIITPEIEGEMGSEMSVQVMDQIGHYADAELEAYVNNVGQRLVAGLGETPYTFRFAIVDQFEPNAFASPGGYIYVSRGLLAQMNYEAELAGVLAHEISHVTQRHHARQMGRSMGAGLFTLPGRAVGVVSKNLGNIINAPIEAAGQVFLSSYSRGQESEADAYGMRLAAVAGYNPLALADALNGIERTVEARTGEKHKSSFFDSHPTTPTRVSDISSEAATIALTPLAPIADQLQLYASLDGMWVGQQNPQQGVFFGENYRNADFNFGITFPDQWKTMNTPRFVAAAEPDGGAYLALTSSESEETIFEIADRLAQGMREEAGIEPSEDRTLTVGSWPARLLRYDDSSAEETVSLYYLLVQSPQQKFMLMAMGYEKFRDALGDAALSLRPLTQPELDSIGGLRMRVTKPQAGDSLAAVNQRVGSKWPLPLAAAYNGLATPNAPVIGRPIKYSRTERYVP